MTRASFDPALDVLLAGYLPPAPRADLADRVSVTATALPQEGLVLVSRQPRDRRGGWLRRPLLVGGAALGLAFSGAVAATYAGVELPPKVRSVLADIPFVGVKAPEPDPEPIRAPRMPRPAAPAPVVAPPVQAETRVHPLAGFWRELSPPERRRLRQAPPGRRLLVARRIVNERRAAGLPTPNADRIEQAIAERRAARARGEMPPTARQRWRAERRARLRDALIARQQAAVQDQNGDDGAAATQGDLGRNWQELIAEERRERRAERRRRFLERPDAERQRAEAETSTPAQMPPEEF